MSGNAQVKIRQKWQTNVKKIRRVGAHKSMSTNSGWPMSKRQDEGERTCQNNDWPVEKDTTSGSAKVNVHQQWLPMSKRQDEWKRTSQCPPTMADQCQKDRTSGSALVNVHQQSLTCVKMTRRVGVQKPKSTNSGWPMSKRQDEWKRSGLWTYNT